MKEKFGIKGKILVIQQKENGERIGSNHNIITQQGDALLADLLSQSPSRAKVDQSNGIIELGTGWTGNDTKNNTGCNTPFTAGRRALDSGYPQTKGTWGATDDNVVVYQSTYPAGSLSQSGIDEVALKNGASGDCLAYAQMIPTINMALTDSLQILWEITFEGS
ncbi:MAG: hypothetical protein PF447_07990 [Spirochaetaceae bacterium]|jgi:hypothetical protein|nr:hypothetical protein [Spirochaetaceae bacterium]